MTEPINIVQEYKEEIHRLQHMLDLYRARLIDEVMDHHNMTKQAATFDVDHEVMRHLPSVEKQRQIEIKII